MQKYPKNWKAKSLEVRTASGWRCAHCERQCRQPKEKIADFIERTGYEKALVEEHPRRWSMQAAHLNHDPENEDAELIALCLPCHRFYDNRQMAKIRALERERQGQLSIDQQPPKALEGWQLAISNLAEPCGVINAAMLKPVTPGTLVIWLEERLDLFPSPAERLAFIRQFQIEYNPEYKQAFAALRQTIPYECLDKSLVAAVLQVQQTLERAKQGRFQAGQHVRRYRPKGQASGYIDTREGNKLRQKPSISYYYRWDSPMGRISEYIPAGKVVLVERLIQKRTPAIEILKRVCEGKTTTTQLSKAMLREQESDTKQTTLWD